MRNRMAFGVLSYNQRALSYNRRKGDRMYFVLGGAYSRHPESSEVTGHSRFPALVTIDAARTTYEGCLVLSRRISTSCNAGTVTNHGINYL